MNGYWDFLPVKEGTLAFGRLPDEGWEVCPVPGMWQKVSQSMELTPPAQYNRWNRLASAWYRRAFAVPADWADKRVKVDFEGVNHVAHVYCNGQPVGEHSGVEPFTIDLTKAVRFGTENTLAVEVLPYDTVDGNKVSVGNIGPGLWQGVRIAAVPAVHPVGVHIVTSVEHSRLTLTTSVVNDSDKPVEAELRQRILAPDTVEPVALTLNPAKITIAPGAVENIKTEVVWATARQWSPADPYLYTVETGVSAPGGGDGDGGEAVKHTRFGFREFTARDGDFYLNGKRIRLRGDTFHSPMMFLQNPAATRALLRYYKSRGVNFARAWGPFPQVFFDVADEEGFMLHSEYDPVVQKMATEKQMQDISEKMIEGWVRANRNHPSILFWTAENEYVINGTINPDKYKLVQSWAKLYRRLDPSRLVQAEGDPCVAELDEIGIHNYHDYSDMTAVPVGMFQHLPVRRPQQYGKPLLIGESYIGLRRSNWSYLATLYLGEGQWRDLDSRSRFSGIYKQRTLETWRIHDVDGIQPLGLVDRLNPIVPHNTAVNIEWSSEAPYPPVRRLDTDAWKRTLLVNPGWLADAPEANESSETKGIFAAYKPVIVSMADDWDWAYNAGETVEKTAYAINDTREQRDLSPEFLWTLNDGEKVVASGRQQVRIPSARNVRIPFSIKIPQVGERRRMRLNIFLREGTNALASNNYRADVFPVSPWPANRRVALKSRVGLYDKEGLTKTLLRKAGVDFREITLDTPAPGKPAPALANIDLLIIGYCAFTRTMNAEAAVLAGFLDRGGKVLCFEQDSFPDDGARLLPGATRLSEQGVNHAFLRTPDARLARLTDDDLQLWRGNLQMNTLFPNLVATRPLAKPSTMGNYRTLLDCGPWLENSPLIEFPVNRGSLLLCQLDVTRRYGIDPVATRTTHTILAYIDSLQPNRWKPAFILRGATDATAVTDGTDATGRDIARQLVNARTITTADIAALPSDGLLIIAPEQPANALKTSADALARFVEHGGTILCMQQNKDFDYSPLPDGAGIQADDEAIINKTDIIQNPSSWLLRGTGICDLSYTTHEKEKNVSEYKFTPKRSFSGANLAGALRGWNTKVWVAEAQPATLQLQPTEQLALATDRAAILTNNTRRTGGEAGGKQDGGAGGGGEGQVILCQIPFHKLDDSKANFILSTLLTNLSVQIKPADASAAARTTAAADTIDLTKEHWKLHEDADNSGEAKNWHTTHFDDSAWRRIEVPMYWEQNMNFAGLDGYAWYRVHFRVPATWPRRDLAVEFGGIDDCDWTYFNGHLIGQTTPEDYPDGTFYKASRQYTVASGQVEWGGDNVLAIRVRDIWGDGGIYSGPVQVRLIKQTLNTGIPNT
jgi:hypothetical protein